MDIKAESYSRLPSPDFMLLCLNVPAPSKPCSVKCPVTEVSLHVRKCDLKLVFYIVIMKIKAGSQSIKETDVCYVARFLFGENGIVKLNKGSL